MKGETIQRRKLQSTTDANLSVSADPAIKKRGPTQDFNDTFIDDSDIL